jgi:hypothetical protein
LQEQWRNNREGTRAGRKKPGRQDIHLWPSNEIQPPGTIFWTGWRVSADHQVCSTEIRTDAGAQAFGIGGDGCRGLGRGLEQRILDGVLVLIDDIGDEGRAT